MKAETTDDRQPGKDICIEQGNYKLSSEGLGEGRLKGRGRVRWRRRPFFGLYKSLLRGELEPGNAPNLPFFRCRLPANFLPPSPKAPLCFTFSSLFAQKTVSFSANVKMSSGNVMLLITLLSRGYRTCFYGGNGRGGGKISVKISVCWSEKQNELRRYSFSKICTMLYSTWKYSSLTL